MKQTTTYTLLLAVILLFAAYANTASAQQAVTKAEYLKASQQHTANNQSVTGKNSSGLIYENYKGITNPAEAKAAWVKDNPELYKKMTEEHNVPAASKTSSIPNGKSSSH